MDSISIFWFRRDLRIEDNQGLYDALTSGSPVLPVFIFDPLILDDLEKTDARVTFIYQQVIRLHREFKKRGSGLCVIYKDPLSGFKDLVENYAIQAVYCNRDYEPQGKARDCVVSVFLSGKGIGFYTCKDHVIFESKEIRKESNEPYKTFTPYKRKWLQHLNDEDLNPFLSQNNLMFLHQAPVQNPRTLEEMGFKNTKVYLPPLALHQEVIRNYEKDRDYPHLKGTTKLGIHLRYGTLSIRKAVTFGRGSEAWLNEIIWREFYCMILSEFPWVTDRAFKSQYEAIPWINSLEFFDLWKQGMTGFPIVDAGMRQLNETGYMHNRIRMIVSSFLTKHLLIDWRWGENYFAQKLLDYELASNNGGWQWAAGTGTDAQPYFRIFNPMVQAKKFDSDSKYIHRWVPELRNGQRVSPIVDHKQAYVRALNTYKKVVS